MGQIGAIEQSIYHTSKLFHGRFALSLTLNHCLKSMEADSDRYINLFRIFEAIYICSDSWLGFK